MKLLTALLLLVSFAFTTSAQIKVDSNYTILAKGVEANTNIVPFIEWDFNRIIIKENATGKICSPASMQFTLAIKSEMFQFNNAKDAVRCMARSKPGDKIFIDKIVLPSGCFTPPKQIVITVM